MLVASEMAPTVVRSSLERMLDSIRLSEEQPEGCPPALPSRPTSRGRLPSARRPLLPVQFKRHCDNTIRLAVNRCDKAELEKPAWGDAGAADRAGLKVSSVDDSWNRDVQGVVVVQKRFRAHRVRHSFQELKKGAMTLQSFVRGEISRHQFKSMTKRWEAILFIQKHVRRWIARKTFVVYQKNVIVLQSVIRGWLGRKQFVGLKGLGIQKKLGDAEVKGDQGKNPEELEDSVTEHNVRPSILAELQKKVLHTEVELAHKEEENVMLQQRLRQYEKMLSEYEEKMKAMEATWQKQLTTLQASLAAAKKSLLTDDMTRRIEKFGALKHYNYSDSEDTTMSAQTRTSEGTPRRLSTTTGTPESKHSRLSNGTRNAVSNLIKEFEHRRQVFENDAGYLLEVESRKSDSSMDADEEFQKLKGRVSAWQKDYKVRLRETQAALLKYSDSGKSRRKWWAVSCSR